MRLFISLRCLRLLFLPEVTVMRKRHKGAKNAKHFMLFAVLTKRANQGELMISLPVRPSFIAKLHSENRDQVNNQITLHPNVPIHSFFCCALILQYPY